MDNVAFTPNKVNGFAVFDSVSISRVYPPKTKINRQRIFDFNRQKGNRFAVFYRNFRKWHFVTVNLSISTFLYGNNLFGSINDDDIEQVLETLSTETSRIIGTSFDAFTGKIPKLDVNRDVSSSDKPYYIKSAAHHHIPQTTVYEHPNGIELVNKSRRLKIYDKYAEVRNNHPRMPEWKQNFAATLFRTEARLFKPSVKIYARDFFGSENRDAGQILRMDFAEYVLNRTLNDLELTKDILSQPDHEKLIFEKIARRKTAYDLARFTRKIYLLGITKVKKAYTKGEFDYRKRLLQRAGIWQSYFPPKTLLSVDKLPNDDWSMYS